jgi:hypothetical protein
VRCNGNKTEEFASDTPWSDFTSSFVGDGDGDGVKTEYLVNSSQLFFLLAATIAMVMEGVTGIN